MTLHSYASIFHESKILMKSQKLFWALQTMEKSKRGRGLKREKGERKKRNRRIVGLLVAHAAKRPTIINYASKNVCGFFCEDVPI